MKMKNFYHECPRISTNVYFFTIYVIRVIRFIRDIRGKYYRKGSELEEKS